MFCILCAFATFIMGMGKLFAIEPMAQLSWGLAISPIGFYLILWGVSYLMFLACMAWVDIFLSIKDYMRW